MSLIQDPHPDRITPAETLFSFRDEVIYYPTEFLADQELNMLANIESVTKHYQVGATWFHEEVPAKQINGIIRANDATFISLPMERTAGRNSYIVIEFNKLVNVHTYAYGITINPSEAGVNRLGCSVSWETPLNEDLNNTALTNENKINNALWTSRRIQNTGGADAAATVTQGNISDLTASSGLYAYKSIRLRLARTQTGSTSSTDIRIQRFVGFDSGDIGVTIPNQYDKPAYDWSYTKTVQFPFSTTTSENEVRSFHIGKESTPFFTFEFPDGITKSNRFNLNLTTKFQFGDVQLSADSDAVAFVDGNNLDPQSAYAVHFLVNSLKSIGAWDNIDYLYPLVGSGQALLKGLKGDDLTPSANTVLLDSKDFLSTNGLYGYVETPVTAGYALTSGNSLAYHKLDNYRDSTYVIKTENLFGMDSKEINLVDNFDYLERDYNRASEPFGFFEFHNDYYEQFLCGTAYGPLFTTQNNLSAYRRSQAFCSATNYTGFGIDDKNPIFDNRFRSFRDSTLPWEKTYKVATITGNSSKEVNLDFNLYHTFDVVYAYLQPRKLLKKAGILVASNPFPSNNWTNQAEDYTLLSWYSFGNLYALINLYWGNVEHIPYRNMDSISQPSLPRAAYYRGKLTSSVAYTGLNRYQYFATASQNRAYTATPFGADGINNNLLRVQGINDLIFTSLPLAKATLLPAFSRYIASNNPTQPRGCQISLHSYYYNGTRFPSNVYLTTETGNQSSFSDIPKPEAREYSHTFSFRYFSPFGSFPGFVTTGNTVIHYLPGTLLNSPEPLTESPLGPSQVRVSNSIDYNLGFNSSSSFGLLPLDVSDNADGYPGFNWKYRLPRNNGTTMTLPTVSFLGTSRPISNDISGFNPSSLPGLRLNLVASTASVSGGRVASWSSGSIVFNTNSLPSKYQPKYNATDPRFNNKPTITFDNSLLRANAQVIRGANNNTITVFIVGCLDGVNRNPENISNILMHEGSVSVQGSSPECFTVGAGWVDRESETYRNTLKVITPRSNSSKFMEVLDVPKTFLMEVTMATATNLTGSHGGTHGVSINNVLVQHGNSGSAGGTSVQLLSNMSTGLPNTVLGCLYSGSDQPRLFSKATIAHIVVVSGAMTQANRKLTTKWLMEEYGIQGNNQLPDVGDNLRLLESNNVRLSILSAQGNLTRKQKDLLPVIYNRFTEIKKVSEVRSSHNNLLAHADFTGNNGGLWLEDQSTYGLHGNVSTSLGYVTDLALDKGTRGIVMSAAGTINHTTVFRFPSNRYNQPDALGRGESIPETRNPLFYLTHGDYWLNFYVNLRAADNDKRIEIWNYDTGSNWIGLYVENSRIYFRVRDGETLESVNTVTYGTPLFISIARDMSLGTIRLYINGVLDSTYSYNFHAVLEYALMQIGQRSLSKSIIPNSSSANFGIGSVAISRSGSDSGNLTAMNLLNPVHTIDRNLYRSGTHLRGLLTSTSIINNINFRFNSGKRITQISIMGLLETRLSDSIILLGSVNNFSTTTSLGSIGVGISEAANSNWPIVRTLNISNTSEFLDFRLYLNSGFGGTIVTPAIVATHIAFQDGSFSNTYGVFDLIGYSVYRESPTHQQVADLWEYYKTRYGTPV